MGADNVAIDGSFPSKHVGRMDEVDCISSLDISNALGQTAELIGKAGVPDGFVLSHLCEAVSLFDEKWITNIFFAFSDVPSALYLFKIFVILSDFLVF